MKREILGRLLTWKTSHRRKPLVLMGARQVGKTWILKEFGKEFSEMIYINFDKDTDYAQIFDSTKDINRILEQLSLASGSAVDKDTLIILDEIQECQTALGSLKYFCEDRPDVYVVAAGSLLGLSLSSGFPVGKVNFLHMYPMTFTEFLTACGEEDLVDYMRSIDSIDPIPDIFFNRLMEKLKVYYLVGGMPEVVESWISAGDINEIQEIQEEILISYERDMGKHPDKTDIPKIHYIWDSVVSQLSKENKKFLYSVIRPGARAREYENALNWLVDAGFLMKTYALNSPQIPIDSYRDLTSFKIYMNDVGLLHRRSGAGYESYLRGEEIFGEFRGAFTENYVLQTLMAHNDTHVAYWKDIKHEVDFVIQINDQVFPLETKSGKATGSPSLKRYREKYAPGLLVRTSAKNLSLDGDILNIPLFLMDRLKEIVNISKHEKRS